MVRKRTLQTALLSDQFFYRADARLLYFGSNGTAVGTSLCYLARVHRARDG